MIRWLRELLRRMFGRGPDPRKAEMAAARSEHAAALVAADASRKHVERAIAERRAIDRMMREADVSMFGERMEKR